MEAVVQRCARCGSVLHFACRGVRATTRRGVLERTDDDLPWWPPGVVVAEYGSSGIGAVEISDRTLDEHEIECPALNALEASNER